MPFTPVHIGPGILLKALLQGSFSLVIFAWAQILMDIQPLMVMLTGKGHLHGFSHTYIGASLIAIIAALSGKYLSEFGCFILHKRQQKRQEKNSILIQWQVSWKITFISSFIGTFSHVFLDSIMHTDVEPFFPFSVENNLWAIINMEQLHLWCLYSGLAGLALYFYFRAK